MILRKQTERFILRNLIAYLFIGLIILLLISSLNLKITSFTALRLDRVTIWHDFASTFLRVTVMSLSAWLLAIGGGWLMNHLRAVKLITMPAVNFIRHISPFAWFPFAIIWFGLGESPVAFVLFVTLFFPALVAVADAFSDIPHEYLDEANVCGAGSLQLFRHIELPLILVPLINLYRILWGLGWTIVIAAEMLGTAVGLGYRLLDFRYLLFYEEMIVYLVFMGVIGVLVDYVLQYVAGRVKTGLTH